MLDKKIKAFIVYMIFLRFKMSIHLTWKAKIVLLLVEKITILAKYLDFLNIFSEISAMELFEWLNINKHTINLELDI